MWSKGTLDRKGRISESAREFLTCMEQHRANSMAMRLGNPPPYPELVEEEPLPPNKEKKLVAPLPPNQYIDGTSHQIADSITRPCPDHVRERDSAEAPRDGPRGLLEGPRLEPRELDGLAAPKGPRPPLDAAQLVHRRECDDGADEQ